MDLTNETNTSKDSPHPRSTRKLIITKTVNLSSDFSFSQPYVYQEDQWEIDPKTGYTYADSAAYRNIGAENNTISPNMSRRGLRQDMHSMSSSQMSTPPRSSSLEESYLNTAVLNQINTQFGLMRQEQTTNTISHQVDGVTDTPKNEHNHAVHTGQDTSSPRFMGIHGLRLPPSETRSGRRYGGKWDPAAKLKHRHSSSRSGRFNESDTDSISEHSEMSPKDLNNYMLKLKQTEYSGQDNIMKEKQLHHLYGLDGETHRESRLGPASSRLSEDEDMKTSTTTNITNRLTTFPTPYSHESKFTGHESEFTGHESEFTGHESETSSEKYTSYTSSSHTTNESTSSGRSSTSVILYPFTLIYSFIFAVLSYLWSGLVYVGESLRWLVSEDRRQDLHEDQYGSHSASSENQYNTVTTTTVTTTEFFSDDDEEEEEGGSYDTVDTAGAAVLKRKRAKKTKKQQAEETSKSWLYTWVKSVLTTVVTVTSTVVWSPITAAQAIGGGVVKTAKWIVPGAGEERDETSLRSSSETSEFSTESSVRKRRSKATQKETVELRTEVMEEESWWFTHWFSWFHENAGNGLDHFASGVCTILLLPLSVLYGFGRSMARGVAWVGGAGLGVKDWLLSGRATVDEDADTDTTLGRLHVTSKTTYASKTRYTSSAAYLSSASESWGSRFITGFRTVLWWPFALLLALLRWIWWALCSPYRWLRTSGVGGILSTSMLQKADKTHRRVAKSVATDVWILSRTSILQRYGCCCLLPLLILLPFLLTGLYYVYDRSLFVPAVVNETVTETHYTVPAGVMYTDSDLDARIRAIVIKILHEQKSLEPPVVPPVVNVAGDENYVLVNEALTRLMADVDQHKLNVANQINIISQHGTDLNGVQGQLDSLVAKINELSLQIGEAQAKINSEGEDVRREGAAAIIALEKKLGGLELTLKDCCKSDAALAHLIRQGVEKHLAMSTFVNQEEMESRLAKLDEVIKGLGKGKTTTVITGGLDEEHVNGLIQDALSLYHADNIGQPDYALESAGGTVIHTRCSETYTERSPLISLFGVPLWYQTNSPRTVIDPGVLPGQCWPFKGDKGYLVIGLSTNIYPTSFTMEHTPKVLNPFGGIDSAPKDFTVWGLEDNLDNEGILLGNFTYRDNGRSLQTFNIADMPRRTFGKVELRINSNHGNPNYTCLYRFRVHGKLVP